MNIRFRFLTAEIVKFSLVIILFLSTTNMVFVYAQTQPLTQAEFSQAMIKTYRQNDQSMADSLIRNNRLLVKPFVNSLITGCIESELKGKVKDATNLQAIASRAAESFEKIFSEKSLVIGVNYLTVWNREQKEKKLIADSLYTLGTRYRIGKEKEKALECMKPALEKYGEIGDERGEAEVLGGLGALYFNNYNAYEEAFNFYNKALLKREKVDDKQLTGNTLNSLGAVYHTYLKDYLKAVSYYEKAEAIRLETGEFTGLRTAQLNKALAYKEHGIQLNINGKFHDAIESLGKAYEIDKKNNAGSETGDVLSQMGFVYSKTGDYGTAVEKLTEAAKIMKEENDSVGLAGVFNHFGIVLQRAGRTEKALDYLNNSLKIYEEKNDLLDEIPVIDNLGSLFYDLKEYTKAEEFHNRGLKICRELKDREKEVDYLLNLANDQIYLNKLDDSRLNYEAAMIIARSFNNPDLIWRITVGLAENHEQSGDYEKAVELNDSALAILEGLRNTLQNDELKASFMAKERFVYEDIIGLLETLYEKDPGKGYDKLAFSYAERSKSRVLLDLLSGLPVNETKGTNTPVNKGNEDIKSSHLVSLDEAKTICSGKNTVILEYMAGDSISCLWVINKSGHQLFRLPDRKKLQEQVETIRFAMLDPGQPVSEFFTEAGNSLYEELIKPAEPYLSKNSNLIIIPDGVLNYLPFEVLLTNKVIKNSTSWNSLPFLVKKHALSYGQSASVLKNLLSESAIRANGMPEEKKLIAFGDPVYNDSARINGAKFKRLEYSSGEVENIASLFRNGTSEIFLRNDATEENVKKEGRLAGFSYIHFATHGLIDENKPDLSSLVLTKNNESKEDGLLTASEIFNLKLNADLVVLSACQTGLGKLVRGEGMVGLTRAFMYAGTPSVLVSLWSVSDISTSILMGEFYKNLIRNKLSKTDALRRAQMTLLSDKKLAHPFYWAPFVLIGDWR